MNGQNGDGCEIGGGVWKAKKTGAFGPLFFSPKMSAHVNKTDV
jgi:hypothetical protein